jgi:hypothetical protein
MFFRVLGGGAACAMIGSLFLPWLQTNFGPPLVPWDAIRSLLDMDPQLRSRMMQGTPPAEIITFGLSFVAALLFLLTVAGSRLLAFLSGALPFVTVGLLFARAANASNGLGRNLPSFESPEFSRQMSEFLNVTGPGLTLWFGSAAALLLIGLFFSPTKRPAKSPAKPR